MARKLSATRIRTAYSASNDGDLPYLLIQSSKHMISPVGCRALNCACLGTNSNTSYRTHIFSEHAGSSLLGKQLSSVCYNPFFSITNLTLIILPYHLTYHNIIANSPIQRLRLRNSPWSSAPNIRPFHLSLSRSPHPLFPPIY